MIWSDLSMCKTKPYLAHERFVNDDDDDDDADGSVCNSNTDEKRKKESTRFRHSNVSGKRTYA